MFDFGIGFSELMVIAVIAIIFVGPRELLPMLRTFGQTVGKLKRMAGEFQSQFNEALREAELDDVKKSVESIQNINPIGDIKRKAEEQLKPLADVTRDIVPETGSGAAQPASAAASADKKTGTDAS